MTPRIGLAALALAALHGCSTSQEVVDALAPAADIGFEITCADPCQEEWQRAQIWLATYSLSPLELVTDVVLQTFPPGLDTNERGFIVVREPIGDGDYAISMQQICENQVFECRPPNHREVEMAFLYYVQYGEDLVRGLHFNPDHD